MTRQEELAAEIAIKERELAELKSKLKASEERLASLCAESNRPASNKEKIALFRLLFRGREDVFPRRWENPKTGKSGYSPACSNEWDPERCEKNMRRGHRTGSACGRCAYKAFIPVSDREVADHLKGAQVIGVYPLLADDSCWFLAIDFDGDSWKEDVEAFGFTCKEVDLPVAIERSRSGNGATAIIRSYGCNSARCASSLARRKKTTVRRFPEQS
jgi:hypothetical protein